MLWCCVIICYAYVYALLWCSHMLLGVTKSYNVLREVRESCDYFFFRRQNTMMTHCVRASIIHIGQSVRPEIFLAPPSHPCAA